MEITTMTKDSQSLNCIVVSVLISQRVIAMGLVCLITWNFAFSWMQEEKLIVLLNKTQQGYNAKA
jgi:hypothetical protein